MSAARFIVGVVIACLVVRTFVALGVVEPMTVSGASMAPGLADGDGLIVDRLSPAWRPVERWDRVVVRLPDDATRLGVKRVVGLPGERVAIHEGDLWVNGTRHRKPLDEQLAVRQLVHRETAIKPHWRVAGGRVRWRREGIVIDASEEPAVLEYRHPGDGVIRDDLAINASISRRLNRATDLMLGGVLRLDAPTRIVLFIDDGARRVSLAVSKESLSLAASTGAALTPLAACLVDGRLNRPADVLFSVFDQQVVVAIGEELLIVAPLPAPPKGRPAAGPQALSLRVEGGGATISDLSVWRDVHYERRPIDLAPTDDGGAWRLGKDRWFLIGDNQAVSLDSRGWLTGGAGVPGRLVVGRVAGD